MTEIIPAIIPKNLNLVRETLDKVLNLVEKAQIDIVDGNYSPVKTWPFNGSQFEEIRKICPKQLFIAHDGPRRGNKEDKILCKHVREIVKPTWPSEIKTLFRKENLVFKEAVSSSLT